MKTFTKYRASPRKPFYIYQFLIGSSHNDLKGSLSIFFRQAKTFCVRFFAGRFGQIRWREIDIQSYSWTCPAVFVCVTGPVAPPSSAPIPAPSLCLLSLCSWWRATSSYFGCIRHHCSFFCTLAIFDFSKTMPTSSAYYFRQS